MSIRIILAFAVLLSGCATQSTIEIPEIEQSDTLQVKDLRPEMEKQSKTFSFLITSESYGMYRLGDSETAPPGIRVLQHRIYEKYGTDSTTGAIKVHHFVVYRNMQAEFRRSSIGAGLGGVVGAMAQGPVVTDPSGIATSLVDAKTFESLAENEHKRAQYTEEENPGRGSVYVIYIETEMQGKRVFTRAVAPMKNDSSKDPFVTALESSIQFHLSQY